MTQPEVQIKAYLEVLAAVAAAQGWHETAARIRQLDISPAAWAAREQLVAHETAAFVDLVRDQLPDHRHQVYVGLTSSNLQDTAEAHLWQVGWWPLLRLRMAALIQAWSGSNLPTGDRPARTHGRDTELVVPKAAIYQRSAANLRSLIARLENTPLRANLGGPVGQYSKFLPRPQAHVAADKLGLSLDPHGTQIADRHQMATIACALTQVVGVLEQVATVHRLSAISGVDMYLEHHVTPEQKGSSSMPHKRNPVTSEQICGLARVARANLSVILETSYTQWWERDLTNSSVERTAWRDLVVLTDYLLARTWSIDISDASWAVYTPPGPNDPSFYRYNQAVTNGQDPAQAYQAAKQ